MNTKFLTNKINNLNYPLTIARDYIGASLIGHECLRKIWYEYQGQEKEMIDSRIQRTWEIGKTLEFYVVQLLRDTGLAIETPNEQNNYLEFCDKEHPWFKGHLDAKLLDPLAIIEIKTTNNINFNTYKNKGLRYWNKQYYAQIQTYMGFTSIPQAYLIALNKDTSELWDELVPFDAQFYKNVIKEKAQLIYNAKVAPPKINGSPSFYICKMCQFRKGCHG